MPAVFRKSRRPYRKTHPLGRRWVATYSVPPTVLAVNDANWFFSPYNWRVSGSAYGLTVNPGAYFRINFNGTSATLLVDTTSLTGVTAAAWPKVRWSVDAGAYQNYQLQSGDAGVVLATGVANSQHALWVYLLASDAYTPRWDGTMSLKITGLQVDSGTTSSAPTLRGKRAIFFGDSITEGAWSLGTGATSTYVANEDATASWAEGVAEAFGCELGNCSFGGQSWDTVWNSDVPTLPNAWNFYYGTNSRLSGGLLSPAPDYAFVNMGTNGGLGSAATLTTWLGALRTAAGALCKIVVIIPFNGTGRANITSGVQTYQAAHPADLCYLVDLGTVYEFLGYGAFDGLHPDVPAHGRFGATVAKLFQAQLTGGGGTSGGLLVGGGMTGGMQQS